MNYIKAIDEEIAQLRLRIDDLYAARRAILTLDASREVKKDAPKVRKPAHTRSNHGALKTARREALAWLGQQTEPLPSRLILAALAAHKLSDSTVWKALKEMRDEGLISWDETTRYYSIVRRENPETGTIADQFKPGGIYADKKVVKS